MFDQDQNQGQGPSRDDRPGGESRPWISGGDRGVDGGRVDGIERRIDEALRDRFAMPSDLGRRLKRAVVRADTADMASDKAADVATMPDGARGRNSEPPRSFRFPAAARVIAASLLLAFGLVLILRGVGITRQERDAYAVGPLMAIPAAFDAAVDEGFEPDWICRDDPSFAEVTERMHGVPVGMFPLGSGVTALGMKYTHTFSPRTTNVLLRVDGEPVIVFIDRGDAVARQAELVGRNDAAPGWKFHEQRLDELVLIEYSPFKEPRALPSFHREGRPAEGELPLGGAGGTS